MVFGNMGNYSGTGVAFTCDPSTGENILYGEISRMLKGRMWLQESNTTTHSYTRKRYARRIQDKLQINMSNYLKSTINICNILNLQYNAENFIFYKTRTGKRTAQAAIRIAVEMVQEGIIHKQMRMLRVDPEQLYYFLHRRIDDSYERKQLAKGLPASPGAATGAVAFDADEAERLGNEGKKGYSCRQKQLQMIYMVLVCTGNFDQPWGNDKPCSCSSKRNGKSMHLWL